MLSPSCRKVSKLGSTKPFAASMGHSWSAVTADITSSLARVWRDDRGRAPGLHNDTSSRSSRSTRCSKSTEASLARRTSSPGINSSVISATNTQIRKALRHSQLHSASFKTGSVSPDAVCRMYGRLGLLSGCPAVMSGLAMVTDYPVSVVTQNGLSCIHPSGSGCHRSSWLAHWMWNEGLSMMTPVLPSSRWFLLIFWVLFDLLVRSVLTVSSEVTCSHTASIQAVHSCSAWLVAAAFP
jgi:hypothetical protein